MSDTDTATDNTRPEPSASDLVIENLRAVISQLTCPSDDTRVAMIEQAIDEIAFLEAKIRRLRVALDEANQRTKLAMDSFGYLKNDIRTKAAIAAMQGMLANPAEAPAGIVAPVAVWNADKLIAELQKEAQA